MEIRHLLEKLEYKVTGCSSPISAVDFLNNFSFHLMMVDSNLLAKPSRESVSLQIVAKQGLPLVLMCDTVNYQDVVKSMSQGVAEHLQRPLSDLKLKNIWYVKQINFSSLIRSISIVLCLIMLTKNERDIGRVCCFVDNLIQRRKHKTHTSYFHRQHTVRRIMNGPAPVGGSGLIDGIQMRPMDIPEPTITAALAAAEAQAAPAAAPSIAPLPQPPRPAPAPPLPGPPGVVPFPPAAQYNNNTALRVGTHLTVHQTSHVDGGRDGRRTPVQAQEEKSSPAASSSGSGSDARTSPRPTRSKAVALRHGRQQGGAAGSPRLQQGLPFPLAPGGGPGGPSSPFHVSQRIQCLCLLNGSRASLRTGYTML